MQSIMSSIPKSKRFLDLSLTLIGGLIISPIIVLTTLLVYLAHGSPVLFRQIRPGYQGKPFTLYKFRTMTDKRDEHGNLLSDDSRLTRLGKFLRSTSLDELPELINVLKGEMSWVGPRPLLMQYLERYTTEQARRHDVLPGITGWAQINGRNTITWEDKFILDIWYVDNWSLSLDVKILLLTIWKVITREGVSQPGYATAEEFMGTQNKSSNDRDY
jgi:lipopolysaccharide/colanic/teichoic acid biosynthesis glycosyltransferase